MSMHLKNIRQKQKLSQSQLARASDVNIKTIQAYEQDVKNINNARLEILLKLSITLNCKLQDLITNESLTDLILKYERMNENVK